MTLSDILVLLRGGGDLATGVAVRLHRAGFSVLITELPQPLTVRRGAAFGQAVYAGETTVEGITARLAEDPLIGVGYSLMGEVPVVVDPEGTAIRNLRPPIVVDGRMAKSPLDSGLNQAPLVIGLGPGLVAGEHCHAVVETNRGHDLGRVLWKGRAQEDTGHPEPVAGQGVERVLRAPASGEVHGLLKIGDRVEAGELIARVGEAEVRAAFSGVLRGLMHDGVRVPQGMKIGDLDPRGARELCFTVSDKARAVGGGVLEAILAHEPTRATLFNPEGVAAPPAPDRLVDRIFPGPGLGR